MSDRPKDLEPDMIQVIRNGPRVYLTLPERKAVPAPASYDDLYKEVPSEKKYLTGDENKDGVNISVMTNYLEVQKWPTTIFEYSIIFLDLERTAVQTDDKPPPKVHLIRDKKRVFEALEGLGFFP